MKDKPQKLVGDDDEDGDDGDDDDGDGDDDVDDDDADDDDVVLDAPCNAAIITILNFALKARCLQHPGTLGGGP